MILPTTEFLSSLNEDFVIMWHRRDLRLKDNTALNNACQSGYAVLPIFIFDPNILDKLEDKDDPRLTFISQALEELALEYENHGNALQVFYGTPETILSIFASLEKCRSLFTNEDYEPYARERDEKIKKIFQKNNKGFYTFKDQVIFSPTEIYNKQGEPYTIFTPYAQAWQKKLLNERLYFKDPPSTIKGFLKKSHLIELKQIGFTKNTKISFPERKISLEILRNYQNNREFPYEKGTSRLGVHLRFGTLSIRQLVSIAVEISETFLKELIWREFFMMLLWHFPKTTTEPFRPAFRDFPYENNTELFQKWCCGETGYPLVDAGMRELNSTGFMHNRVRMVCASFLTKHLLIDWRWGERYFARRLLDFDLSANVGNWQWAAGCGADAQPYFRIFNPLLQAKKFDPNHKYILTYCPEYQEYPPKPIIEHDFARQRALTIWEKIKKDFKQSTSSKNPS